MTSFPIIILFTLSIFHKAVSDMYSNIPALCDDKWMYQKVFAESLINCVFLCDINNICVRLNFDKKKFECQLYKICADCCTFQNDLGVPFFFRRNEGVMDCMWYKIMDPDAQSGVYNLIGRDRDFQAHCDMETDGGGWTVIASRDPASSIDIDRSWQEYKHGFGNVSGQFYWIGNDNIHELTKQRPSDVYFKIETILHGLVWLKYTNMTVLSEEYKYRLSFDENSYEGNFDDVLGGMRTKAFNLQNMAFSTYDSDNDGKPNSNCAELWGGGWWYNYCGFGMTGRTDIMHYYLSELRPGKLNMMMIRYKKPK